MRRRVRLPSDDLGSARTWSGPRSNGGGVYGKRFDFWRTARKAKAGDSCCADLAALTTDDLAEPPRPASARARPRCVARVGHDLELGSAIAARHPARTTSRPRAMPLPAHRRSTRLRRLQRSRGMTHPCSREVARSAVEDRCSEALAAASCGSPARPNASLQSQNCPERAKPVAVGTTRRLVSVVVPRSRLPSRRYSHTAAPPAASPLTTSVSAT